MDDDIQSDPTGPVLVVGGYGTVGGDVFPEMTPAPQDVVPALGKAGVMVELS
ncbi:hypothetical protein ABZW18_03145 [Streptomyces sp. NPDC004647]|uniref:hypothetical protein n=1 Tax=Streptomyces sp. NPDC004647 TaxID=3154671 RepID=UPI0033BAB97E